MIVFDVIQVIDRNAARSPDMPIGEWLVAHFNRERDAEAFANRCNECAGPSGPRYRVEAIDEENPLRKHERVCKCGAPECHARRVARLGYDPDKTCRDCLRAPTNPDLSNLCDACAAIRAAAWEQEQEQRERSIADGAYLAAFGPWDPSDVAGGL